jgi:uncharacterized protein YbjT (DUF2867 family)
MSERVLVIGGTGMLGLPVARQLKADGLDVTVLTSNLERTRTRLGNEFRLVEGDVTRPETLRGPIGEVELVHLNLNSRLDPALYQAVEIEGTAAVARIAAQAKIKRLSMISGASSTGELIGKIYLDAKVEAERAVMESGVPYTIMRPSWFFESLPGFVQGERVLHIGRQPLKRAWLAAADYAKQVSRGLRKDEAADRAFYNLGPVKLTIPEALSLFCQRVYPERQPQMVSYMKAQLLALLPGMRELRRVADFFKYMEVTPEPEEDRTADRILGPNLTTLEEWLDRYQRPSKPVA